MVGALINTVFLMALCFTILIESLTRFYKTELVENPDLLLIVGGIGLSVNVIGLLLFAGHGHSHGENVHNNQNGHSHYFDDVSHSHSVYSHHKHAHDSIKESSAEQLNMKGVFLHVLGDALGSVVVIGSALAIKYGDVSWSVYIDPGMSLILVIIICSTSIPLLKQTTMVLLQTVPTHIEVAELHQDLLANVNGVLGIHEFHVWQLTGKRIIASAHIRCAGDYNNYPQIAEDVKQFFHANGIHSITIQPEFDIQVSRSTFFYNYTVASAL